MGGNCKKVVEILDLIIDNEATSDDKDFFYSHIDKCAPCLDYYEVEKDLKDFIVQTVEKKKCSESLKNSIEQKMQELFSK